MITKNEIDHLKNLFCALSPSLDTSDKKSIFTECGKAASIHCAVEQCIQDYSRTAKFIEAIGRAIKDKGKRILYIGSGPFGFLVLPILLHSEGLEITFIEINEVSHKNLVDLCGKLNLGHKHKLRFIHGDACSLTLDIGECDILVSETMNAFLFSEPFVDIAKRNVRHLRAGGALIPEKVELYWNNKKIFQFDEKKARANKDSKAVAIKEAKENVCQTRVTVYKEITLDFDESLITRTKTVRTRAPANLFYKTGRFPGICAQYI